MRKVDLLISAKWVVPMDSKRSLCHNHTLVVDEGRILNLLPSDEVAAHYHSDTHVQRPRHVLLPGLVNAHTHAAMSLFRGVADDLPLHQWLQEHIWPLEQKWVDEDFVRTGVELACCEMIRSGTTCFNDMYLYPEITAQVVQKVRIRAMIGLIAIDFPTVWASHFDEYMQKGLALYDHSKNHERLHFCFAPHAPYTLADKSFRKLISVAHETGLAIHTHLHETAQEVNNSLAQSGKRPMARLDELGLLSPTFMAVHMTQLNDDEIHRLHETSTKVITCPRSNAKLASGLCPLQALQQHQITVAIGTDGAASNNTLNMIEEMRFCSLLAKVQSLNASTMNAFDCLEAATLGGARAMGLEHLIGSLCPGKYADCITIDLYQSNSLPVFDPISQIVFATDARQVADVWVEGFELLRDGQLQTLDSDKIHYEAGLWADRIRG